MINSETKPVYTYSVRTDFGSTNITADSIVYADAFVQFYLGKKLIKALAIRTVGSIDLVSE